MERAPAEGLRPYELGYQPALDGLRGVAVLAVIAFHGWFLDGGFFGVDVFFVLSGALITMILAREHGKAGKIDLPRFYKRRLWRLLPAFAFMLVVTYEWVERTSNPYGEGIVRKSLIALFYLANIYTAYFANDAHELEPVGHTWSLATEEQFYLLWPTVLPRMLKRPRKQIITALLVGMLVVGILRAIEWKTGHQRSAYHGPIERADGLMAGCIVGLLTTWGASKELLAFNRRLVVFSWLVLCCAFVLARPSLAPVYLGGFTLVNLAAASVVLHVLHEPPRVLQGRALVWIGKVSYSLYLFNLVVRLVVCPLWDWPWLMLFQVGVTFACAAVTHYAIERPLLRWRDRPVAPRVVAQGSQ